MEHTLITWSHSIRKKRFLTIREQQQCRKSNLLLLPTIAKRAVLSHSKYRLGMYTHVVRHVMWTSSTDSMLNIPLRPSIACIVNIPMLVRECGGTFPCEIF